MSDRTRTWLAVAGLVAVAALLRTIVAVRAAGVHADGAYYLWIAEDLAAGRFAAGLGHFHHPLYPAAVALVRAATGLPLEVAGRAASIALGSLAVLPLFLAFRAAAGGSKAIALAGAALYAVHPYAVRAGGDVRSEPAFFLFLFAAVAAALRALAPPAAGSEPATGAPPASSLRERAGVRPSTIAAGIAGACAGLAYLARPEALAVALAVALLLAIRRRPIPILALGLGLAATAGPYISYLRADEGEWRLTRKKSVAMLVGAEPFHEGASVRRPAAPGAHRDLRDRIADAMYGPPPAPEAGGATARLGSAARGLLDVGRTLVDVFHPVLAAFALVAVARARAAGTATPGALHLAALTFALLSVHALLRIGPGYLHRRHLESEASLLCFFAGAGVVFACARVRVPALAGLVVLLGVLLPKALAPKLVHIEGAREAGRALAALAPAGGGATPLIVGRETTEVAFYAGCREDPMPPGSPADVAASARRAGAGFVGIFFRAPDPAAMAGIERELAAEGLVEAVRVERTFEGKPHVWILYALAVRP